MNETPGRKQNHTDSLCRKSFFVDGSLGRTFVSRYGEDRFAPYIHVVIHIVGLRHFSSKVSYIILLIKLRNISRTVGQNFITFY